MDIKLKAEKRNQGEKLEKEFVAGVLYGLGVENKTLKLKANEFSKVYSSAGESNLIKLEIDGEEKNVLIKEIQKDPIKNFITHVDFYQVDMKRVVSAEIPLKFIGESRAMKELGGLLVKNLDELSVECLPGDLLDHITVDISVIQELGQAIYVKDIKVPASFKIFNNPEDSVVTVIEPREEAVVEEKPVEEVPVADKKEEKKAE
ncbi:MAG: 50S ribosomal protein L25 [Patescibacteria group bacterium]|nr:50S ribosomal protein L25 [Patescibacteria group bacterium]